MYVNTKDSFTNIYQEFERLLFEVVNRSFHFSSRLIQEKINLVTLEKIFVNMILRSMEGFMKLHFMNILLDPQKEILIDSYV